MIVCVLGVREATIPSHNSDGQLCRGYLRSWLDPRVPNSTAHCRRGAGWRVGKASNDRCAAQGLGRCSRQSLCRKQHCIPADQEACRHLARVGPFLLLSWIPGGHQRSSSLLLSAPPPLCSSSSYFSASLPPSQSIPPPHSPLCSSSSLFLLFCLPPTLPEHSDEQP